MHPIEHAKSSAKKYGGNPEDYIEVHNWFDETKSQTADPRHRALRHHSEGIFLAERIFGLSLKNSIGEDIPVRYIGEQHVQEDLGFIPTVAHWLENMELKDWMYRAPRKITETIR